jgi:hypothetical protein
MISIQPAVGLVIAFAATAAAMAADAAGDGARPEPAPAANTIASQAYRSAFDAYQPFTDEKISPWRETNDTVGRIGGWRAYAREVQGGAATRPSLPASSTPPSGAAHQP